MKLKYGIIGMLIILIVFGVCFVIYKRFSPAPNPGSFSASSTEQSTDELRKEVEKISANDNDLDGLSNEDEKRRGTNPESSDSDADGLLDSIEVNAYQSDPLKADTDGDGIIDGKAVRMGKDPTGKTVRTPVKFVTTTVE